MKITSGASAATRLRREEHVQEGKKYKQIFPTAGVIMKNESDKRSLGCNKTQKGRACSGKEAVRTDIPNSGGHYEK